MQAQTPITSCGYTITEAGNYEVASNLGPCGGDGIDIEASNVQLKLNGHTITGSGSSVGIYVNPAGTPRLSGIQIQGPGLIQKFFEG
jgi:hypothetical protein